MKYLFAGLCVLFLIQVVIAVTGLCLNKPAKAITFMGFLGGICGAIAIFVYPLAFGS